MTLLIKNGTLITSSESYQADILVDDEKVSQLGRDLSAPSAQVIDAWGSSSHPVGWIHTRTSICRCSAQSPRMTITPVTRPRPSAERRP